MPNMRKILVIAFREYRAMVGTKAFILSIAMMPILMFGGLIAVDLLKNLNRSGERTIAVIDQTGQLFERMSEAVAARNALLAAQPETDSTEKFGRGGPSRYQLESIQVDQLGDDLRIELSNRVRNQELYAFVEIPANAFDEQATPSPTISFHSQDSGLSGDREWLQMTINEIVKNDRLVKAGIDPGQVAEASKRIPVRSLGLFERTESGDIRAAEKDELSAIFLPMGVMMLMFMVIFLAAQPMLESVLEEKSQRIAEVLLGSANPFELMMGKLLGTVAGSLTVFGIYFVGGLILAQDRGWTGMIPFYLFPWFVAFQILGVLFYASVFMAVGSACTQLKEAQSMLLPVWLVMMIPFFVWFHVVREPNSLLSVVLSFFPPATPSMMVLRLATGQTVPLWQPLAGMAVSILSTLICVLIAARIFRAGLLWQGKTPRLAEVFRWATARN
jgi:ABC-type Na+ efflux pump permease subunit